jgi:hypothetical protein
VQGLVGLASLETLISKKGLNRPTEKLGLLNEPIRMQHIGLMRLTGAAVDDFSSFRPKIRWWIHSPPVDTRSSLHEIG